MSSKISFVSIAIIGLLVWGCNNKPEPSASAVVTKTDTVVVSQGSNAKGIGRFKNVELTHPLSKEMVALGKQIFDAKCSACHKLTDEKLVGPGWKGVTERRSPEWIMNFITNTQVMLDKDLVAQSEVVTCIVRMPNQDLDDYQARQILEFMRSNDGKN